MAPCRDDVNAPLANRTVLIVDDEPFIRVVLSDVFADAGFTVEEASSAAEAMMLLEGLGYCIDLLLTDVKMPGDPDGLGLALWAREHCPQAKVVIMTGYAGEHGPEEVRAYDAFVRKPFTAEHLIRTAQNLLA